MTKIHFGRSQSLKAVAIFIAVASLCAGVMAARWRSTRPATTLQEDEKEKEKRDEREKFLFVWAGDQARTNPDFLAVVNFDESSRDYGKIITTLPLPGPGATGNEPHHVGLSRDGRVLACGGLLSVLRAQKEIFFFDVSNPKAPRFLSSPDPPMTRRRGGSRGHRARSDRRPGREPAMRRSREHPVHERHHRHAEGRGAVAPQHPQ